MWNLSLYDSLKCVDVKKTNSVMRFFQQDVGLYDGPVALIQADSKQKGGCFRTNRGLILGAMLRGLF